ncbi:MAG: VRR-NUC domain-containing protein [Alphaproteobacteria bacterium]|nr:VRR-NUC domain-containing protein [Alphaproteobacteria bacterium]
MAAEKNFESRVKRWLEENGVYPAGCPADKQPVPPCGWYLKTWGGGMQKTGIPDLLICVNGLFLSCELKADNGKPSDLQKKNTAMINAGNGMGLILWPDGFSQFKNIVKGMIACNSHIPVLNALKNANDNTKCDIWNG